MMLEHKMDRLLNRQRIEQLLELVDEHVQDARYPGAQLAMAHEGELIFLKTVGLARCSNAQAQDAMVAKNDSLWLLYSNTKVILAAYLWKLFEEGVISFNAKVSHYLPAFARHGKEDITIFELITHQAGFPNAEVTPQAWSDSERILSEVCDFQLEWRPASQVSYHALSAHWVLAMVIEAVTGLPFKRALHEGLLVPLQLDEELCMGLGEAKRSKMAHIYEWQEPEPRRLFERQESTSELWQDSGAPGGGAYGTAKGLVMLYQMMVQGGMLNGQRYLSEATLAHCIKDYTHERIDTVMGLPMHRGLGPHLRGEGVNTRGLGTLAHAGVFGHGGVGSSYAWADPQKRFSFAYITNARAPEPWHSLRMERVSNLVHLALSEGASQRG